MGVSCWADFETGGQWAPLYQQTTVAPWAQAGPSSGEPRAELVEVLTWAGYFWLHPSLPRRHLSPSLPTKARGWDAG